MSNMEYILSYFLIGFSISVFTVIADRKWDLTVLINPNDGVLPYIGLVGIAICWGLFIPLITLAFLQVFFEKRKVYETRDTGYFAFSKCLFPKRRLLNKTDRYWYHGSMHDDMKPSCLFHTSVQKKLHWKH